MGVKYVLGGDIGGTNSRFQLYKVPEGYETIGLEEGKKAPGEAIYEKKYENHSYQTFNECLKIFIEECKSQGCSHCDAACIAVAGPVNQNKVTLTNRGGWVIDGDEIAKTFAIEKVKLVNDFVAQGYGLLTLDKEKETICLQPGVAHQPGAPIACIGAGTGLGVCFLTAGLGGYYDVWPTEGGHSEFSPRNWEEVGLLQHLMAKFTSKHRVSQERIVSGTGILNVYEYLCSAYPNQIDQEVHAKIEAAGDNKGKEISIGAQKKGSLCDKTLDIFTSAYGSEAGVAGLKYMPFNGLYLTGGITPKQIDRIKGEDSLFMQAYHDKGRVAGFLARIPLYAVMVEDLGERGALWAGVQLLLQD